MGHSVRTAKRTLDYIDIVGVTEDFDGFMVLLANALDVPASKLNYRHVKKMMDRPRLEEEDPEALKILREILQTDYEIYGHARTLYDKKKQEGEAQGWGFNSSLAAFKEDQAKLVQRCRFRPHTTHLVSGYDCYPSRKRRSQEHGSNLDPS